MLRNTILERSEHINFAFILHAMGSWCKNDKTKTKIIISSNLTRNHFQMLCNAQKHNSREIGTHDFAFILHAMGLSAKMGMQK
jgi:hypothetical protein